MKLHYKRCQENPSRQKAMNFILKQNKKQSVSEGYISLKVS